VSEPVTFTSSTPRFALPMLFAGQAQKEFFFNEAQLLIDSLLHCAVEGVASAPPSAPNDGESWLVDTNATGDWTANESKIALRFAGEWKFIAPRTGLKLTDISSGKQLQYDGAWKSAAEISAPQGGATIDTEARNSISALIQILRDAGILART
jgi:hypothetical protein